jgi:hypothetical protein
MAGTPLLQPWNFHSPRAAARVTLTGDMASDPKFDVEIAADRRGTFELSPQ